MARIIYSGLVTEIAGSIGGTTFQRNAYGFTIKNKPNMVNAKKPLQNTRKTSFASTSQKWRGLTQTQRDLWIALSLSQPVPSRLNPNSNLNGFNLFCRYHNFLALVDDVATLTNPSGVFASLSGYSNTLRFLGPAFQWFPQGVIAGVDWYYTVFLTNRMGAGQIFVQETPIYMTFHIGTLNVPVNLNTVFPNQFGVLPSVGDRLGCRVVMINTLSGQIIVIPTEVVEII